MKRYQRINWLVEVLIVFGWVAVIACPQFLSDNDYFLLAEGND